MLPTSYSEETTSFAEAIVSTSQAVESGLEKMATEIKNLEAGMLSAHGSHAAPAADDEGNVYMKRIFYYEIYMQFDIYWI